MSGSKTLLNLVSDKVNAKEWRNLNWEGSFHEYLDLVYENPMVIRNAYQRVYDMIESYGRSQESWVTTDDPYKIGWIGDSLVRVSVFKVMRSYPDSLWEDWRDANMERRKAELVNEERERDMRTIRTLVEKHGLNAMEVLAMAADD